MGSRLNSGIARNRRSEREGDTGQFDERQLRPRPVLRRARSDDVSACAEVWREAIGHYLGRLNRLPPGGDLASLRRIMDHVLSTDDRRFWVAERPDEGRIVGFGSATMRDDVWFLALLFVLPDEQGLGVGRELLARTLAGTTPRTIRATVTDSAQPISNAMYARIGIVPRVPILHLLGPADDLLPLPALPAGVSARPLNDRGPGAVEALGVIDREVLGYERPSDHAFFWRDGRRGFAYEGNGGTTIGYGYTAPSGRVGPIAALDGRYVPAFVGHLLAEVPPADAASVWVAGSAGGTVAELLRAGFRIDGFPALLAWDRPFGSFERYVPATLALL